MGRHEGGQGNGAAENERDGLPERWARLSKLAPVPLFESEGAPSEGAHAALLDSGSGSFAISENREKAWSDRDAAAWAWSSDFPHHVGIVGNDVLVTRWDHPRVQTWSLAAVEDNFDSFYARLARDRVRSNRTVVEHVLNLFRRIRSLVATTDLGDERSTACFLEFLDQLIDHQAPRTRKGSSLESDPRLQRHSLLSSLPSKAVDTLLEESLDPRYGGPFTLLPSLAVRHAGSAIFQEAHFELTRPSAPDLFGHVEPARSHMITRGGAHYTPSALARTLAEQTIGRFTDVASRQKITILDPSCGSGSMLNEALRVLRRRNFSGTIALVGRDTSPAAVSMARFVLRHAVADWQANPSISIDIKRADSLTTPLTQADIILMNPPFVAWTALDDRQRERMRELLGNSFRGRPDFSMAFVFKALESLAPGGVLGTFIPASLLTVESALAWRRELLQRAELHFLAFLGGHQLFSHAIIQVAVAVLAHPEGATDPGRVLTMRVDPHAAHETGNALRALRAFAAGQEKRGPRNAWEIFETPHSEFAARPTWHLLSSRTQRVLSSLLEEPLVPVAKLFNVRQGVRTGNNKAFLIDAGVYGALRESEQRYFKPAIVNASIQQGRISEGTWLFYPYDADGPLFDNEQRLADSVPTYLSRVLSQFRPHLSQRPDVLAGKGKYWWDLAERRASWALRPTPRLVSKYFGAHGAFAVDLEARFAVVQGHAWFLRTEPVDDPMVLTQSDLLHGYFALLNSSLFNAVLKFFSPVVAGGQYNLSPRYVTPVPIPDLASAFEHDRAADAAYELTRLGREPRPEESEWVYAVERLVAQLYGPVIDDLV